MRERAARRGSVAFSRLLVGGRKDGDGGALDIPPIGHRGHSVGSVGD